MEAGPSCNQLHKPDKAALPLDAVRTVSRLHQKTAFNVLYEHRRGDLKRCTKAKQHPDARAVAAEFDQGHIVAIRVRFKRQLFLAPLAL